MYHTGFAHGTKPLRKHHAGLERGEGRKCRLDQDKYPDRADAEIRAPQPLDILTSPLFQINRLTFNREISFFECGYHILDTGLGLVESDGGCVSFNVGLDFPYPFDPLQDRTYPVCCGRSATARHVKFDNPYGVRKRPGCAGIKQHKGHRDKKFQRFHTHLPGFWIDLLNRGEKHTPVPSGQNKDVAPDCQISGLN